MAELKIFVWHYSQKSDFFFKNLDEPTSKRHFSEFSLYKILILISICTIWRLSPQVLWLSEILGHPVMAILHEKTINANFILFNTAGNPGWVAVKLFEASLYSELHNSERYHSYFSLNVRYDFCFLILPDDSVTVTYFGLFQGISDENSNVKSSTSRTSQSS